MKLTTKAAFTDDDDRMEGTDEHRNQTRLWLRLLACTTLIGAELRRRFRDEFDITLARFEILAQLDRQPGGVILGSLSKRLMVSQANLTPIIARLIKDDLITRRTSILDKRVQIICLTVNGRCKFRRMAQKHAEWLRTLLRNYPDSDVRQLTVMLGQLKRVVTSEMGEKAVSDTERTEDRPSDRVD